MKARMYLLAGLFALSGLHANAQMPGFAAAAPAGAAAAAVPAAPPPAGLFSFLGLSKAQLADCRRKCCAKPCGQFIAQMFIPMTTLSGGLIQQYCPIMPSPEEMADPGAVGAAAKVKADEAGAKARRAAVRYLGSVDCHYWPEAEGALIDALRGDRNECVRFEAALALGNGCCCTKKTMEALRIASSCKDTDGNPKETSDRVRAAAVMALEHCTACWIDPNPPKPPEKVPEGKQPEKTDKLETVPAPKENTAQDTPAVEPKADIKPVVAGPRPTGAAYYAKITEVPQDLIVEECRKAIDKYKENNNVRAVLGGQNSLAQIVDRNTSGELRMSRGETANGRPQNLWDMLAKQSTNSTGSPATAIVKATPTTAAPALAKVPEPRAEYVKLQPYVEAQPLPEPIQPSVKVQPPVDAPTEISALPLRGEQQPNAVLAAPEPVKVLQPADIVQASPYGNQVVTKPKIVGPSKLPIATSERTSLKPESEPKEEIKKEEAKKEEVKKDEVKELPAPMPAKLEPVGPVATPVAKNAMQAFGEANSPASREQAADALTAADIQSCPDLQPALLAIASGKDADSTRKSAIRALVRTNSGTPDVMAALDKLTEDPSAGIRVEAAIGMARLKLKMAKN